jgi:hypothetical protein
VCAGLGLSCVQQCGPGNIGMLELFDDSACQTGGSWYSEGIPNQVAMQCAANQWGNGTGKHSIECCCH